MARQYMLPLILVAAVLGVECSATTMMVWSDKSTLYKRQRSAMTLKRGRLVETAKHKKNDDWVMVRVDDKAFSARRKDFRTLLQIEGAFERAQTHAQHKLTVLNRRLDAVIVRRRNLYQARLEIQRDRSTQFRQAQLHVAHQPATVNGIPVQVVSKPRYSYHDVVAQTKSKRLLKKWNEELEELEKEYVTLRKQQLELVQKLADNASQIDEHRRYFDEFNKAADRYQRDLYLVVDRRASLFAGVRKKTELKKGKVVYAAPNVRKPERLLVEYQGKVYDAKASHFRARRSSILKYERRHLVLRQHIANLEADLELKSKRLKSLQKAILQLDVRHVNTQDDYVIIEPTVGPRLFRQEYVVKCPRSASIVTKYSRARRTLKAWAEEREELAAEVQRVEAKLGKLKAQRTDLEVRHRELQERYEQHS